MVGHRQMAVLGAVSLIAVGLMVASCGGGGSTTPTGGAGMGGAGTGGAGMGGAGTGAPAGTPVAECNEFVNTFCDRNVVCAGAAGTIDKATCVSRFGVFVGCERTTSSFAECLGDVKVVSCSTLSAGPPPSCDDPINKTPLSAAQMKCFELAGVYCQWSAKCQNLTPTAAQLQNCQGLVADDFGCLFAISVSQQCIDDLPAAACGALDGGAPDGGSQDGGAPITPSCSDPITLVD